MRWKRVRIKYPKFLLLILIFLLVYIVFYNREFLSLNTLLSNLGLLGAFLAGIFYPWGFTAAPATAILLIIAKNHHVLVSGLIAGFGALLSNLLIFKFIRGSFKDELKLLSKEKIFLRIKKHIYHPIAKIIIPFIAAIIIASPLPDEIGDSMMATSVNMSAKMFSIIAYILSTAGIFIILLIGKSL